MKKKKKIKMICSMLVVIVCGIVGFALHENYFNSSPDDFNEERNCSVERVIDGDTIVVTQGGKEYTVRMIGVNTPESVSPYASKNTEEGEEASEFTKNFLRPGTVIYLEFDKQTVDRYGRLLAYVWGTNRCDYGNYAHFCKYNYGAILMQETYCEAAYYPPNEKYRSWYEQLEEKYQN